jgi:hypothetical protein
MRVERFVALAGFAFVASIVGTIVTGTIGPDVSKSAAEVAAKVASKRTDLLINSALWMAAGVAFLCFAAGLATVLASQDRGQLTSRVLLISGAAAAAASFLTAVLIAAVASSIHLLPDSATVYVLYRGAVTSDIATDVLFGVSIAASAIGLHRLGLLNRKSAGAGVLAAAVFLVGGFDFITPTAGPLNPVGLIGGVLGLLYVVAVSVILLRTDRHGTPAA